MALEVGELFARLRLDKSDFDRGINSIPGGLATVGKAAVVAAAGVGTALAGAAAAGLHEFAGMQRGMNEVFTMLPGISQAAMDDMVAQVRGLATEIGVVPDDIIPALYQSLSAGVPADNVFAFLEQANQAAVAGVTDLTTAVDGITSVVNAYGDQIGGAGEASDLMFTAVRLGKTTFDELAGSLSNVAPIAAANGVGFDQITAAIASMTAQGIPTAQTTTMLRQAIVELSDSASVVGEAFQDVAGKSFRDFMAEGGNLGQVMGLLEQHAADTGVSVDQLFGSVEAGGAALALGGANAEGFASNLDAMANSAGATQTAYEQMDQGLGRAWDRIKAAGMVLLGHLGEQLAPAIEDLAGRFIDNLPAIQETATRAFETIGEFITGRLMPALAAVQAWWADNGPAIIDAATTFGTAVGAAFATIGEWVQQAAAWLTATFGEDAPARAELDSFAANVQEWGAQLVEIVGSAWDAIEGAVTVALEVLRAVWSMFGDDITQAVQAVWSGIQTIIGGFLDMIQGLWETWAGIFTGDWDRAWNGVKQMFAGVWEQIRGALQAVLGVLQGLLGGFIATVQQWWSNFTTALSGVWSQTWQAVRDLFASAWATLQGNVQAGIATVTGWWQTFTGTIRSVWDTLWSAVRTGFDTAWSGVRASFDAATAGLRAVWDGLTGGLRTAWDGLWTGITVAFSGVRAGLEGMFSGLVTALGNIWNGIKGVLAAPINWVADNVINGLIGGVNTVARALGAGNILSALPSPLVPTHHAGGIVGEGGTLTSGPLRPGERIIKALDGEEVLTADDPRHSRRARTESDVRMPEIGDGLDGFTGGSGSATATSGIRRAIDSATAAAMATARDLIAATVRPLLNGLLGQADSLADRFGPPGRMVSGAARRLVEHALGWLEGVEDELAPSLNTGGGFQALIDYLAGTGTPHRVTSTVRPGSITNAGNLSRHALGLAVDFAGPTPTRAGYGAAGLRSIFQAFVPVEGLLNELILAGAPYNIKRGNRVPPYAVADHWDHVHAALAAGGTTTLDGSYLVGERGPELVNLPRQSSVIPLSMLGSGQVGGMLQTTLQDVWDRTLTDLIEATEAHGSDLARLVAGQHDQMLRAWEQLGGAVTERMGGIVMQVTTGMTDMSTASAGFAAAMQAAAASVEAAAARAAAAASAAQASAQQAAAAVPPPAPPPAASGEGHFGRADDPLPSGSSGGGWPSGNGWGGRGGWGSSFVSAVRAGV